MKYLLSAIAISTFALACSSAQAAGPREACKQDVQTYCSGVQPGQGRIISCLKDHKSQLSDGCISAIKERMRKKDAAGAEETQPARPGDDNVPGSTPPASEDSAQ